MKLEQDPNNILPDKLFLEEENDKENGIRIRERSKTSRREIKRIRKQTETRDKTREDESDW